MSYILEYLKVNFNLFLSFLIVFIAYQLFYKKFYKYRNITKCLPTVYGLPFGGIIYRFWPMEKLLYSIGSYFDQLKTSSYLTWFANQPLIITVDPDIIKHVLNSDEFLNKARSFYQTIDDALPNGIITSKVYKWKHNRKLMNSSLTFQNVQKFIPIFNKNSQIMAKHFESFNDRQEYEIFPYLKHAVLQMAVETTMGTILADGEKLDENLADNFNKLLEKLANGITLSFVNLDFLIRTPTYYKMIEFLKNYIKKLIVRKIDNSINNEDSFFLNLAIKYQQQGIFHIDDTINETYTMIVGSFETTSTTLYSIIIMLAMHPEVQEKLYEDLIKIIPDSVTSIEYEHLQQLPYLTMVMDETLRLMPPIPLMGRETLERCQLTSDISLPRDFQILISIFHLHRRKDLWGEEADKFNPDNFLPENIEKRHPYAYVPFSKGVRNCIGWRYAQVSVKILLLQLLRNYKFTTKFQYDDLVFMEQISLRFLKEPKIQLMKRKISSQ